MAFSWSLFSLSPVRRIGRFLTVVAIALAAGHLAQTLATRKPVPVAALRAVPTKIVELSASPDDAGTTAQPVTLAKTIPDGRDFLTPAAGAAGARDCMPELTASTEPGAKVALTLRAPCDTGARVVVAHGGLTVTERVATNGRMLLEIPALDQAGQFEVRFADGRRVQVVHQVPDLASVKRFAVQWLGPDGFVLHGLENDADFGQPGDVSPINPGPVRTGGALVSLGDPATETPLMAQVYTYPAAGTADIVVEAPVTAANCGQVMLGQTISSLEGMAQVVDLTLAMPDCSAVGDFLVLKNLASDMKLALK